MFTGNFRSFLFFALAFALSLASVQAQKSRDAGEGYSESRQATRSRTAAARTERETSPARILRSARTIYIEPNDDIDPEYLAYKLGKYPDFEQWKLSIVTDKDKADLVLKIHRKALNYIFSLEEQESSIVVTNGKTVAINDLVATDQIAKEIIRRMKAVRALPTDERN
jgi:hypothetical protein